MLAVCQPNAFAGIDLITNGSFENPSVGSGYSIFANGDVPGWTSNNNEIEIDYTPLLSMATYDGTQSVELNGTGPDTISQTVSGLTVGDVYNLTWGYGDRPGYGAQEAQVFFGGALVATDNGTGTGNWTPNSIFLTATSTSETLSFAAISGGGAGNEIDGVSLLKAPEPSAFIVWTLLGAVGLFIARRRKA